MTCMDSAATRLPVVGSTRSPDSGAESARTPRADALTRTWAGSLIITSAMEIVPSREKATSKTSGKARKSKAKDPAAAAAKKERDAALARVREAVVARVRERFARDMKVLDACEALFAPNVDIETLENSGAILRQQDYQDCVKERTLRGLCGYPLCSASPSPTQDCGSSFTVILQRPGHLHTKVFSSLCRTFACIVS